MTAAFNGMKGVVMSVNGSLHDVLKRWPGVTTRDGFEDRVWQRIRVDERAPRFGDWAFVDAPWLRAAALLAALATGLVVAASMVPHARPAPVGLALERSGTLTGDYLNQVRGE